MDNIEKTEEKITVDGQNEPVQTESGLEANPSGETVDNTGRQPPGVIEDDTREDADSSTNTKSKGAAKNKSKSKPKSKSKVKAKPKNKGKSKNKNKGGANQNNASVKPPPTPDEAIVLAIDLMRMADKLDEVGACGSHANTDFPQTLRDEAFRILDAYGGEKWKQALAAATEQAKKLTLLHDIPFKVVFSDQKLLVSKFLRALTGKENLVVVKLVMQLNLQLGDNVRGRILDCYAVDAEGNVYNLEPQRKTSEANDLRMADHLAHLKLEIGRAGLDPDLPREYWTIFVCRYDPMGNGELLNHRGFLKYGGKTIQHAVYFSCSVARKLAQDKNAQQNPPDGIKLKRWQDLIRWGVDLSAENFHEMQNIQDNELRERVQFVMNADMKGRVSPVTQELIDWVAQNRADGRTEGRTEGRAEGRAEGIEDVARALLGEGVSIKKLSKATGLDPAVLKDMKASLSA